MRHYRKTVKQYHKMKSKDEQLQGGSFCNDYKTYFQACRQRQNHANNPIVCYDMFEGQRG